MEKYDKPFSIGNAVEYSDSSIVSKAIIKKSAGTVTFFAFDKGEELSEHTTPYDALVQITDGEAEITIGGVKNSVKNGEGLLMPANIPHALKAHQRFKMLLTMVKE
jgi:quercetin dioxygenase-like cupin family protein